MNAYVLLCIGYTVVLTGNFTMPYMTALMLAHGLAFVSITLGFFLGLKYWIKGIKAARIFAIAWFSYLVFILIYLLSVRSLIQSNFFTEHALEIGSIIELVLLSLAFADRINEEKDLRLKAQQKTNQELDEQVKLRTEELENANIRLQQISITDSLTGVYNRRHFDEIYTTEYQRAYREKSPIALILIDVDHFKAVNDTHGHMFGDLCLQRVADVIQQNTRRPPDTVARYGGEEFVVMLPNTDLEGAYQVAENIRDALEKTPVTKDRLSVILTASFGVIADIPKDMEDPEWLLREADVRLYQAKDQGRNRVVA